MLERSHNEYKAWSLNVGNRTAMTNRLEVPLTMANILEVWKQVL
jgi:hypothetical protein